MKLCYVKRKFSPKTRRTIALANNILKSYVEQGIRITVRTLYYQFVARDLLPNKPESYNYLKAVLGKARLAGMVDWDAISDGTRWLRVLQQFAGPQDALDKLASWYHVDMWANQRWRPEVWIEKDALVGVVEGVCQENDVPLLSCRGYTSLTEMWRGSMRLRRWMQGGQTPWIIHFGDHDPSGIDMSRDICHRLQDTFLADCKFKRVALTMDQVEEYQPPPNPAKITDSRYKTYVAEYGEESWELDALEPFKFRELIEAELKGLRNQRQWDADLEAKEWVRAKLREVAEDWEGIGATKEALRKAELELADALRSEARLEAKFKRLRDSKKRKPKNG